MNLVPISNGAKNKLIRETINQLIAEVIALKAGGAVVIPSPAPVLTGFALNGSSNPKLKAMLARVKAGAGDGAINFEGDSTTVGQGGGTTADANGLTNARPNRPPAVLAAELTALGYPSIDGGVTADNGLGLYGGLVSLSTYDPRVVAGSMGWGIFSDAAFAGGGFLQAMPGATRAMTFADPACDTFDIVYFNSDTRVLGITVDGVAPTSGPSSVNISSGSGFSTVTVGAASVSAHSVTLTSANSNVAVRAIRARRAGLKTIQMRVNAALGASSANVAASDNAWQHRDALGYDAPDLTIINLGLNDMDQKLSAESYATNLRAIIATAKLSGDVLLVCPHPAAYSFAPLAMQQAFRDVAANVATGAGVAFLSLFDYFGGAFTPELEDRMFDRLVHGNAGLYAEIGQVYRRGIQAMVE